MKKFLKVLSICFVAVFVFIFVGCGNDTNKQAYGKDSVDKSYYANLPVIEINTQNNKLPYDKEHYINCSFEISNCENEDYNFSVSMKKKYGDDESVGIRLRGNSTSGYDKKPYRIKFDKKTSLLGMKKNKSWVLLADYIDQSAIRNYAAFSMAEMFDNLDFTPSPNHVVLFLNGEYKGLYLLTEQVDENSGRTDVKTGIDASTQTDFPFLVEMDRNALSEGVTGVDNFKIDGLHPMEIKYPESDERGLAAGQEDVVFNYIKEYLTAVFTTLKTNDKVEVSFRDEPVGFADLVDEESFIDYHLLMELMRNQDASWGSIYMHKTKDGKMVMGPVWDFDWSCSSEWIGGPYNKSEIESAQRLCTSKLNTLFREYIKIEENFLKVQARWNEVAPKFVDFNTKLREYKSVISSAAKADATKWYGATGEFQFDMQYDYVRLFLIDRVEYLSKTFNLPHLEFLELLK